MTNISSNSQKALVISRLKRSLEAATGKVLLVIQDHYSFVTFQNNYYKITISITVEDVEFEQKESVNNKNGFKKLSFKTNLSKEQINKIKESIKPYFSI